MNLKINSFKSYALRFLIPALLTSGMISCLNSDDDDNSDWIKLNRQYVIDCENETVNGNNVYEKIIPDWAPEAFVLVKWHNDRNLTANQLSPLENSTCYVKYEVESVDGVKIQDSYSSITYGDSIYATKPMDNIVGFWTALVNMHVGDSVTMVIPAIAGYGSRSQGSIKANSTLIYHLKLKSIPDFVKPSTLK